ncbi:unnamed protein product, partial [Staurois parvus]
MHCVPRTQRITDLRKEPKMSAWSCDQLCPITADHMALIISVAPEVPLDSVHQCQLPVLNSATSMPHISAYQCTSMPHISAHLSCLSVSPISATYQCQSVPPISAANQCHLSVPVSAAYQCASVPPISARQCHLTVPVSAAYQCHISV